MVSTVGAILSAPPTRAIKSKFLAYNTMRHEFVDKYRDLERRMKALAESDGDVYLPNPAPTEPVDYILVCMEPSLARWARSPEEARRKVASGFRNFLAGIEPMLLHFSTRKRSIDGH